jgi:hypothetical protein
MKATDVPGYEALEQMMPGFGDTWDNYLAGFEENMVKAVDLTVESLMQDLREKFGHKAGMLFGGEGRELTARVFFSAAISALLAERKRRYGS